MKVIDLLNKIANGEEVPKKIKYNNETFTIREEKDDYANQNYWFTDRFSLLDLNDKVEIIEEDKKIEHYYFSVFKDERLGGRQVVESLESKINEIIDAINEMREDK